MTVLSQLLLEPNTFYTEARSYYYSLKHIFPALLSRYTLHKPSEQGHSDDSHPHFLSSVNNLFK